MIIKAGVNAFTQPALLRATELITGNQVTGQFTIVQTINGSAVLSVVPDDATITSATTTCSTGFRVDYFIYGGTPPYRVTSTFPDAVTLVNSTVTTAGGFFEAITNGTCVDPLVFSIFDAVGLQTTSTLHNKAATSDGRGHADGPGGRAADRSRRPRVHGQCIVRTVRRSPAELLRTPSRGGGMCTAPVATVARGPQFTCSGLTTGSGRAHRRRHGRAAHRATTTTATIT